MKATPLGLLPMLFRRLKAAQTETAQVWNTCMDLHKQARLDQARWPEQGEMQLVGTVSSETGPTGDAAEKPVRL